ncbi:MAG TPA: hypothetical protein VN661_09720 [Candidatus Acidoferrales bacterium]|nr:hypothetical protein [Candidatus Acidoferrales bacterium]
MPEDVLLDDDFLRQLMNVGEVDILVGVPSHNNAKTIARTMEAIESSFQRNFWRERGVIVNVDAGSRDGTAQLAMEAHAAPRDGERGLNSLRTVHRIATHHGNGAFPGAAFRTIMAAADLARAKACAIISPDSGNVTSESVANLLHPIHRDGFDFVAPLYRRSRFDGLLARNVLYPFYRAAFGYGIRELHSGEFGFSGRLAAVCLAEDGGRDALRAWPEGWIATSAVSSQMRCCQAFLGARPPAPAVSGTDVVAAIRGAIDGLFCLLESRQSLWMPRTTAEPVQALGPDHDIAPDSPRINRKRILDMFRSGVSELRPVLQSILAPQTLAEIERLAPEADPQFRFPDEVWVKSLYELAGSYHRSVISRDHMIQAFVPLYRGRIYSFLLRHQESSAEEIEADSESLCLAFERLKPYLLDRWTAKS